METLEQAVRENLLLHLQSALFQLEVNNHAQVSQNIYEIGQHLGFSPNELNQGVDKGGVKVKYLTKRAEYVIIR